ncbi:MAG: hypothetical protein LKJ88_03245 [Bacilli bacterium]|jgi:hypothetical protein|nr:hypothetical protein [Bacilli bacterium]
MNFLVGQMDDTIPNRSDCDSLLSDALDNLEKTGTCYRFLRIFCEDTNVVEHIHKVAQSVIRFYINNQSTPIAGKDVEKVILSVSLNCIRKYDDRVWEHLREVYRNLYDSFPSEKTDSVIRRIIKQFPSDYFNKTSIIAVPLMMAIVSANWITYFLDFILDIYRVNFNYDITAFNDQELFNSFAYIYKGLSSLLSSNVSNDELDVSISGMKKTYKLSQYTKAVIVSGGKYIADLISLSIECLKKIDQWSNGLNVDDNSYYFKEFSIWASQYSTASKKNAKDRKFCHKRLPFLTFSNAKCLLNTFDINIPSDCDARKIAVNIILSSGIKVFSKPSISEIFGGYRLNGESYVIDEPLGLLRYKVMCGERILYDSKDSLCRDYLLFNDQGEEIQIDSDYVGTVFAFAHSFPKDAYFIKSIGSYSLVSFNVKRLQRFLLNDRQMVFSKDIKPGIDGCLVQRASCKSKISLDSCNVYTSVSSLIIKRENAIGLLLYIDNEKVDIQSSHTASFDLLRLYLPPLSNGFHRIICIDDSNGKKGLLCDYRIFVDEQFSIVGETLSRDENIIRIQSSFFKCLDARVPLSQDLIQLNFMVFNVPCIYHIISIPTIFSIDDSGIMTPDDPVFLSELKPSSLLRIKALSKNSSLKIYDEKGNILSETGSLRREGGDVVFSIGFLLNYLSKKSIRVAFCEDEIEKFGFFCYLHDKVSILSAPQGAIFASSADFSINVKGPNKVSVCLFEKNNESKSTPEYLLYQGPISWKGKSFTTYNYFLCERSGFWSSDPQDYVFPNTQGSFFLANIDACIGMTFQITHVSFLFKGYEHKNAAVSNIFVNIVAKTDDGDFLGKIYKLDSHKERVPFFKKTDVVVTFLEIFEDKTAYILLLDMDKDGMLVDNTSYPLSVFDGDSCLLPVGDEFKIKF